MTGRERPLVSVVIPTYNRAPRLRRAIDSVQAQEGAGERFDLQVIVVDDGSVDGTPAVALEYGKAIEFQRQDNRGAAAARNAGLRRARGTFVAFLDDDDEWLPHRLKRQLEFADAWPQVGVVYGQAVMTGPDSDGGLWPERGPSGRAFEAILTALDNPCGLSSMLIRRQVAERVGGFDETLPTLEDRDFTLRLALHVEFGFLPGAVVIHRFSKTDSHAYRSLLNGRKESVLPVIVGRGLSLMPPGPERQRLARRAWAMVFEAVARDRWRRGGAPLVRDHLVLSVKERPWLVSAPAFPEVLQRTARDLVREADDPTRAAGTLIADIRAALGGHDQYRRRMNRLEAAVLTEAAAAQSGRGEHGASAWTAGRAVARDVGQLGRRPVWRRLVRRVLRLFWGSSASRPRATTNSPGIT